MQNAMCMRFAFEENVGAERDTLEMDMNASEVCILIYLVSKICLARYLLQFFDFSL